MERNVVKAIEENKPIPNEAKAELAGANNLISYSTGGETIRQADGYPTAT